MLLTRRHFQTFYNRNFWKKHKKHSVRPSVKGFITHCLPELCMKVWISKFCSHELRWWYALLMFVRKHIIASTASFLKELFSCFWRNLQFSCAYILYSTMVETADEARHDTQIEVRNKWSVLNIIVVSCSCSAFIFWAHHVVSFELLPAILFTAFCLVFWQSKTK